jgi:hypothetical protein
MRAGSIVVQYGTDVSAGTRSTTIGPATPTERLVDVEQRRRRESGHRERVTQTSLLTVELDGAVAIPSDRRSPEYLLRPVSCTV